MSESQVGQRLRELLAYFSGAPEATLRADSTPQNTQGWDSMANLNLMAAVEEEFGVTIATRDVLKLRSLGEIQGFVEEHAVIGRTG
jgi:acyl carrier protein